MLLLLPAEPIPKICQYGTEIEVFVLVPMQKQTIAVWVRDKWNSGSRRITGSAARLRREQRFVDDERSLTRWAWKLQSTQVQYCTAGYAALDCHR